MPRWGGLIDTHMNTYSFKINQRIKKINQSIQRVKIKESNKSKLPLTLTGPLGLRTKLVGVLLLESLWIN